MIEQLLNDSKWRRENRRCTFLSLLPVFGWMGFVFMGKRSGRKQYQTAGKIYGVLSSVIFLLYQIVERNRSAFAVARLLYLSECRIILHQLMIAVWLICLIHTLLLGTQYLQFLALKQAASMGRDPLTTDKKWRRENLCWMIWNFFPVTGCFSVWTIGRRLKKKGLTVLSVLSGLTGAMALMAEVIYRFVTGNFWFGDVEFIWVYLWIVFLLVSFLLREDYLNYRANVWKKDTRAFPHLRDRKWRIRNSFWQILTLFPIVGGIGISIAGVHSRNRKYTVEGAVFSLITAVVFCATVTLDNIVPMRSWRRGYLISFFLWVQVFLYLIMLFYGTFIRWDVLRGRANALQGYGSEFERELDLQKRMRARSVESSTEPVYQTSEIWPAKPKPEKQEVCLQPDSVPKGPQNPAVQVVDRPVDIPGTSVVPCKLSTDHVDINHCTQEQLMELPGIGIAQAKRAVEYLQTNGEFQSVDEFVEVLQIKPHFAVQIFSRVTVGNSESADEMTAANLSPVRRWIDF